MAHYLDNFRVSQDILVPYEVSHEKNMDLLAFPSRVGDRARYAMTLTRMHVFGAEELESWAARRRSSKRLDESLYKG